MAAISVIIPVFNRASWIEQTLKHIFDQTEPVDEVIICNDGSCDDLESALSQYRPRVKLINIENSGAAIARKVAIEHARGEWIALCDSDDHWLPDHIARFKKAEKKYPEMTFYFANFISSDHPDKTKLDGAPAGWLESISSNSENHDSSYILCNSQFYEALLNFQPCFPSASIFNRELYESIGGIDAQVSRWKSEDAHLTRRLAVYGTTIISKSPGVIVNKHSENFSSDHIENFKGRIDVLEKLLLDNDIPNSHVQSTKKAINEAKTNLFRMFFWDKKYSEAATAYRAAPADNLSFKDRIRFLISSSLSFFIKN